MPAQAPLPTDSRLPFQLAVGSHTSILISESGTGRSVAEHFYFARGAGWYEWQREGTDLLFNRRGGPTVPMAAHFVCSPPSPSPNAMGIMPAIMARLVIRIGRKRLLAPLRAACPSWLAPFRGDASSDGAPHMT